MAEGPTKQGLVARLWEVALRAAAFGAVMALLCHFLPPGYKTACHAIASVCTGG